MSKTTLWTEECLKQKSVTQSETTPTCSSTYTVSTNFCMWGWGGQTQEAIIYSVIQFQMFCFHLFMSVFNGCWVTVGLNTSRTFSLTEKKYNLKVGLKIC